MSLAAACQELLHVRQLLKSIGIKFSGPFKMFEDNQGGIALATNALTTNRTKHIDVRYHFFRQCVQRNQVKVIWIPTLDMVADILTKFSCSASQHYALVVKMMGGRYKGPSSQPSSEESVRGHGITFCGAMYGCSLMYLSLDPVLCDTTVDR